jgi:hypothetical protein
MYIFLLILGIALGLFVLMVYVGHRLNLAASKKLQIFFENIDQKYEDFIKPFLAQKLIEGEIETLDIQGISEKFMSLVRGDIEALISVINTTESTDVKIRYKSQHFQMVIHKAEELYMKRYTEKRHLNEAEKTALYQSFSDCLKYTLEAQLLKIKSGTF